jgi:di/tricarboxylate transporter
LDIFFAFAILVGMVGLLIWDRIRYDLVAMLALLASIVTGIVPAKEAFKGFSDDIVIIVGSALVISAAIARSGIVEQLIRPLTPYMRTVPRQIGVLATTVAVLSAFIKNIGALAMLLPVAIQIAKRNNTSPSSILMPLSFASLIGGLLTLVGTSPNIITSRMRQEILGEPFQMFDYFPVGLAILVAGLVFLTFGYRLLPGGKRAGASEALFDIRDYTTEVRLPEGSPMVGKTVGDLEALAEGEVNVSAIVREGFRRYVPAHHWTLFAGDIVVIESDPTGLTTIIQDAGLELVPDKEIQGDGSAPSGSLALYEAVVTPGSLLIGRTPQELHLREQYAINLLALSRRGRRLSRRLRLTRFDAGDVVMLQGFSENMPDTLAALGLLPLAERNLQLGSRRRALVPAAILGATVIIVAFQLAPIAVAFFGAAVAMLATNSLSLKEAYNVVEWPILILLGALIPVSDAVKNTGGTDLIAAWISHAAVLLPPLGALGLVVVAAMAVTPFLNNAATVLVMAPISASLAQRLGLNPDPFLMAVAVGAACDFLTPIGHQCNTLVMGPGGYRFGDYWRLGLPLSIIVVIVSLLCIPIFWPLRTATG